MAGDLKLTKAQKQHLRAVSVNGGRSAYPGLLLGTLEDLERCGLLYRRSERGYMFSPQNYIRWLVTEAGRSALAAMKEEE